MNASLNADVTEQWSNTTSLYREGRFYNHQATQLPTLQKTLGIMKRYITEKKVDAMPLFELPLHQIDRKTLDALSHEHLHLVKLGHSSILLKVYGEYWLIDPVFSERASPFQWLGPKRFHQPPISLQALPPIDRVLISHNHYDHLDKHAIQQLLNEKIRFYVPLGVEGDLIKWGVNQRQIENFDWWQELQLDQAIIAFTPTQHFSGRGLSDSNKTLWGAWVIKTASDSLFFSGDSGYFEGFKQIGKRYGPFDLTMIETGAYDKDWADIHMTPEESVQAHLDLQGKTMMPIHNGTFDLAFHAWYEPLNRVQLAAEKQGVQLSTPIIGQIFTAQSQPINHSWWQETQ